MEGVPSFFLGLRSIGFAPHGIQITAGPGTGLEQAFFARKISLSPTQFGLCTDPLGFEMSQFGTLNEGKGRTHSARLPWGSQELAYDAFHGAAQQGLSRFISDGIRPAYFLRQL